MSLADYRGQVQVRVFGSFEPQHLAQLAGLVACLHDRGFEGVRTLYPDDDGPRKPDDEILDECLAEARSAELAFFVLFRGPQGTNQSVLIELRERLEAFAKTTGEDVRPSNTAILVQEGVNVRTLLRGLIARHGVEQQDWRTDEELCRAATAFIRNFFAAQ